MGMLHFNRLGEIFANQSKDTWRRLSFVKDSFQNRGALGSMRFGEETITDLLMMDLFLKGSTVILFKQTPRPAEAKSGTDFELWLGTDQLGWYRYAIQAKKLDLRTERYLSLTQKNSNGLQINLLERFAHANRATPLYCLYNYTDKVEESQHWHCCNAYSNSIDERELGCSVTPSSIIRKAIAIHGAKNFNFIHRMKETLPWRCLVSCPKILRSLAAITGRAQPLRSSEKSLLFDASSCYHDALPRVLRSDGGAIAMRESKSGGLLMSLNLDADRDTTYRMDRIESADFGNFRGLYHPHAGVPKAAAVLNLEPSML